MSYHGKVHKLSQFSGSDFLDFKKAFVTIYLYFFWTAAGLYGKTIFRSLYYNSSCCVKSQTGITEISI